MHTFMIATCSEWTLSRLRLCQEDCFCVVLLHMVAGMTSQETNQILIAGACDDLLGGTSLRNHYLCSILLTFFMRQVIAYNAQ